jgi:hypothetical protein
VGLTVGEKTATAAVGNAMRTTAARSPPWMIGGKRRGACDTHVAMGRGERGGGREESVARRPAPFEAEAGEVGVGWGSRGVRHHAGLAAQCRPCSFKLNKKYSKWIQNSPSFD